MRSVTRKSFGRTFELGTSFTCPTMKSYQLTFSCCGQVTPMAYVILILVIWMARLTSNSERWLEDSLNE